MQTIRIKTPQVYRITQAVPVSYTQTRNMAFSMFPRFAVGEFAPLFRLLDDYTTHQVSRSTLPAAPTTLRSFQPRFDVRESQEGYELQGELPGIDQRNIDIEFTDAHTLTIKGRSERHTESGTQSTASIEGTADQARLTPDTDSTTSYHKPSVAEEDDNNTSMSGALTPSGSTTSTADNTTVTQPAAQAPAAPRQPKNQSRYWVSERSVGEFQRTFSFPTRVDQENVKASLKNGILSIVVPKAAAPVSKRISIE